MKRAAWVFVAWMALCVVAEAQTTIYWKRDHIYAGPGGGEIAIVTPAPSDSTVPTTPTGLGTTSTTATSVALSWTGSTDSGGSGLAGYKVYRQKGSGASLPVGTVNSSTTAFTDQPLEPSTSYSYTIVAFDLAQNHSSASSSVNVTTSSSGGDATAPTAPPQLTGRVIDQNTTTVSWLASTDAGGSGLGGYRVKRNGSDLSSWLSATTLTYTDTTAPHNSSLTYTVVAKDGNSNISSASNSVVLTTPLESTPPTVPGSASASALSSTSIRISWNASTDSGGSGLTGYKVYRAGGVSDLITGTTFDQTGLNANTNYSGYTVKAFDGAGNVSAATASLNATTLPDTTPPTQPASCSFSFSGYDLYFTWSASTDSGGSGLVGYQAYYNIGPPPEAYPIFEEPHGGTEPGAIDTEEWTWDYFTGFTVRAVDGAGNLSTVRTCTEV